MDDDKQTGQADMSSEQAQALAALTSGAAEPDAEVARIEGQAAQAEQSENDGLVAKNASGLMMIFDLAVPTFSQFGFPNVAAVFVEVNGDTKMTAGQTLAVAWAPVLAKYGVDLSQMSDKYKVEIMAVMVTVPIAKALYAAVQADTVGKRGQAKAVENTVDSQAEPEAPKAVVLG